MEWVDAGAGGTRFLTKLLWNHLAMARMLWAVTTFVAVLATQKTSAGEVTVPYDTIVASDLQPRQDIFLEVHMGEECLLPRGL